LCSLSLFLYAIYLFFFFHVRPPPLSTLFPYTTLFRSVEERPEPLGRATRREVLGILYAASQRALQRPRTATRRTWSRSMIYIASDRKSTRLNSSHVKISYAVFCLKKKKQKLQKSMIIF